MNFKVSHSWPFAYIHTDMSTSVLEIGLLNRRMCSSALWHKFCIIFHCSLPQKGFEADSLKVKRFLFSTFLQYQPIWCARQCFSLFKFQAWFQSSFVLIYKPWNKKTRKTRSEWSGNHVSQMQLCRIRFYLKSAQYLISFDFSLFSLLLCKYHILDSQNMQPVSRVASVWQALLFHELSFIDL